MWANRTGSERYPALQGRGPQIGDMSALRWEDQTEGHAVDNPSGAAPQPASPALEPAEVRASLFRPAPDYTLRGRIRLT